MNTRTITASLMLLAAACPAMAQTRPQPRITSGATVLEPFARCRAIQPAEARADCFDAAARALEAAIAAKDVTIVNRQDVREARRSLFGFTLPRIGLLGGDDRDRGSNNADDTERDEFKEIQTTITAVRSVANGRLELRIAEGDALWVTTDPVPFPPKPGSKVRIRKGAMGNYFIAVEGERSVRGMRLR
jgi:hypothetical protein